mgnify:CR=1 FL=1
MFALQEFNEDVLLVLCVVAVFCAVCSCFARPVVATVMIVQEAVALQTQSLVITPPLLLVSVSRCDMRKELDVLTFFATHC